jgi:hypothetical protein
MEKKVNKKILTQNQALKKKVGTYYHPTKKTYREGACPVGKILKRGYLRKTYEKKNGKIVKSKYINVSCVTDKGLPGKVSSKFKVIKIKNNDALGKYGYETKYNSKKRFEALIKAASVYSYSTVVKRINAIRILSKSDKKLYKIYTTDLENLKQWRKENPKKYLYKKNNKSSKKSKKTKKESKVKKSKKESKVKKSKKESKVKKHKK